MARTRDAVVELRELLERPETRRAVEHRTVPPRAAIAIQETVDREDVLAWWHGALGELHAILGAQGLQPAGPAGGMYASEIFQHGRGDATVFIPTDGAARPIGRVERLVVPPAELAIMLHRGSLADSRPHLRRARRPCDATRDQRRGPIARGLPNRLPRDERSGPMGDRDRMADIPLRFLSSSLGMRDVRVRTRASC